MDYYQLQNIQADTAMRDAIGKGPKVNESTDDIKNRSGLDGLDLGYIRIVFRSEQYPGKVDGRTKSLETG